MATIVGHLSLEEVDERLRATSDATEIRHIQAIRFLAKGHTFVEVADVVAFVPRWVEELAQRYNARGPAALGNGRRKNGHKASLLTREVLEALSARVKTIPSPESGGQSESHHAPPRQCLSFRYHATQKSSIQSAMEAV